MFRLFSFISSSQLLSTSIIYAIFRRITQVAPKNHFIDAIGGNALAVNVSSH